VWGSGLSGGEPRKTIKGEGVTRKGPGPAKKANGEGARLRGDTRVG